VKFKQFLSLSLLSFVSVAVCAQPLDLTLRDLKKQSLRHASLVRFAPEESAASLAESYCTNVTQVFSLRSQHPTYGNRVNQNNKGYGFKCRIGSQNPTFVHLGGLVNSQWGTTFIGGIGKQVDIFSIEGPFRTELRYYVGAELDVLSYEWPSRRMLYFGVAPLWHQGAAIHFSSQTSGFSGAVGIEQQHLPVDSILVYQGYFRITKRW
jgi:hypothetical protein